MDIISYSLAKKAYDLAKQSDPARITDLEINLLKTNFKFNTFVQSSKYSLKNITIDTFEDASGIDASSTCIYTNQSVVTGEDLYDLSGGTLNGNIYTTSLGDIITFPNNPTVNMFNNIDLDSSWWHGGANGSFLFVFHFHTPLDITKFRAIYKRPNNGNYTMRATISVSSDSTDGYNGTWIDLGSFDFSATAGIKEVVAPDVVWMKVTISNVAAAWTACSEFQIWAALDEAICVSTPEVLPTVPQSIMLVVDETLSDGSITYYVSRNNGITWMPIIPDVLTSLNTLPIGQTLVVKAEMHGTVSLNAWGYAWN